MAVLDAFSKVSASRSAVTAVHGVVGGTSPDLWEGRWRAFVSCSSRCSVPEGKDRDCHFRSPPLARLRPVPHKATNRTHSRSVTSPHSMNRPTKPNSGSPVAGSSNSVVSTRAARRRAVLRVITVPFAAPCVHWVDI